jgi:hypothetical protein
MPALPPPLLETGVRADARAVGLRLGRAAAAQLGGELEGRRARRHGGQPRVTVSSTSIRSSL